MELKTIVRSYATRSENGVVEINLEGLSQDKDFRNEVVKEVVKKVSLIPHACIVFPSYKKNGKNPLGSLINELAVALQIESLVTGNIEKIKNLRADTENVVIIKHSFRSGKKLKEQVEQVKTMGYDVSVISLIAHSGAKVESFAHENDVKVDVLIYTDEINYL